MKTTFKTRPFQHYRITLLALLLALLALPTSLWADTKPYVHLSEDGTTLTFCYDENKQDSDYYIDDYVKIEEDDEDVEEGDEEDKYESFEIPAWCQDNKIGSVTKVVFDNSFADARPKNCSYWFFCMSKLTDFDGIENLNTSEVTDMSSMFYGCSSLTALNLSHFNTENVTNMYEMFGYCSKLTQLDLSSFNTPNVINMSAMFSSCTNLSELKLTSFDTSKVTDMNGMFYFCKGLTTLDLSKFNTSNVTYMQYMFESCTGLKDLDLYSFDTQNLKYCAYMLNGSTSLKNIYVSDNFKINVQDNGDCMFYNCKALEGYEYGKRGSSGS